jgi:hypothetical protein
MWLAPESALSYTPENAPISYAINGNTLQITQAADEALKIVKSMTLEFCADGEISVTHEIRNISTDSITGASWGINTLDAGGTAFINKAYKAYLPKTSATAASISLRLDGSTGIENAEVTIQDSESIYDLMGRRVVKMVKGGMYIVGGKKVLK